MSTFRALFSLLDYREKIAFFYTISVLMLFSLAESLSLALLVPYIGLLSQEPAAAEKIKSFFIHLLRSNDFSSENLILPFSIGLLVLMGGKVILQIYSSYQMAKMPGLFLYKNAKKLFSGYLKQSYLAFTSQETTHLINHCNHTSQRAAAALVHLLQMISFFFVTLALFAVLLWHDLAISIYLILFFSLLGGTIYFIYKRPQKKAGLMREKAIQESCKIASEALHTFKEVKIYQKEGYFTELIDSRLKAMAVSLKRSVYYPLIPPAIIEYAAISILIVVVIFIFNRGGLTVGFLETLVLFAAVGRRLLPTLNQLVSLSMNFQNVAPSIGLFYDELKRVAQFSEPTPRPQHLFTKEIRCENLFFSYTEHQQVLKGVTFTVPKNQSTAFVGCSGAGKSTLIDILAGLLKPASGKFFIDDHEVPDLLSMRSKMGYVPQATALLNDTIAQNIIFGEIFNAEAVWNAIRISHLESFVRSLPKGIQTIVGEDGIKISGGQKQRLGIARALYRQPEIVIFDEATSSLDHTTESIIADSIHEMTGKKTVIAIAHRLTTVQHFDHIYLLHEGAIIAAGNHADLMRTSAEYRQLNNSSYPKGAANE